ncbi:MAG: UPF0175 family protein [Chloroflexaceae bacterium]|nr:UPF0175 family protein [Chloroflexaceae bacterium]
MNTTQVSIELPRTIFATLHQDPDTFIREMRLAAAMKWYELHLVSQSSAAEIATVSQAEFLSAMARFSISPFQYDAEEIIQEMGDGCPVL